MKVIKDRELNDLYLLGAKARKRLHEVLDNEKPKPIEATAIMDRTFQQRRPLEGQSTENIAYADLLRARDTKQSELEQLRQQLSELRQKD